MIRKHLSIALLALLAFTFTTVHAQSRTNSLPSIFQGEINQGKCPAFGALVSLEKDGKVVYAGYTNMEGKFSLLNVAPGDYEVQVMHTRLKIRKSVTVKPGQVFFFRHKFKAPDKPKHKRHVKSYVMVDHPNFSIDGPSQTTFDQAYIQEAGLFR
ncbi:MAG: carboxypeptidase-like regulatory domain-containing protein [Bacteroidota bacterium]